MSLQFSGVYTGIDFSAMVDAVVAANRGPLTRLQNDKAEWQVKKDAVGDLQSRMTNLDGLTETLSDISNLRDVTGSSSDRDILSVRPTQGASEGTYSIEINQLATAEKEVHKGVADETADLGGGAFVYTYGGQTRALNLSTGRSLEELRDLINDDAGNPGVRASILEYDDLAGGVYHLVLTGEDTGAANAITVDAGTTIADFGSGGGNWTETQTARDSEIRVDGYPADPNWITSSSNSVTGVISNVTLDLHTTGTATVTLNRNNSGLKTHLNNLVEMYNGIVDRLDVYTGYDAATHKSGIMQGDSLLYGAFERVRATMTGQVTGFTSANDSFNLLAEIGLELDKDGHLALDESTLDAALDTDYMGVLKLIGASALGGTDSADLQFDGALTSTTAGLYDVEVDYDASGAITDARIKMDGESSWRSMDISDMTLTGQYGNAEQGVSLTVLTGGVSETTAYQVRVQQGFAVATNNVLDEIMNPLDGAYVTKTNQIDNAITQVSKQIDVQQDRLDATEKRLRDKFARLEATMAQIEGQTTAFSSLFQNMSNSSSQSSGQ